MGSLHFYQNLKYNTSSNKLLSTLPKLSLRGPLEILLLECLIHRYEYRDRICTFTTQIPIILHHFQL
jgi:hypothetical protein